MAIRGRRAQERNVQIITGEMHKVGTGLGEAHAAAA
jgi:hypothetical protein